MADGATLMWVFIGCIHFVFILMICFLCYQDYSQRKNRREASGSTPRPEVAADSPPSDAESGHRGRRRSDTPPPPHPRTVIRAPSVLAEIPLPTYFIATELEVPPPKYEELLTSGV